MLRSIRSDLNWRSSELICWLTADWVMELICAARVKLSVSARSQQIFRLSICMVGKRVGKLLEDRSGLGSGRERLFHFAQQVLAGKRFLQV